MRQHRFQGLEEIATGACLTSTKPKTLHLKACSLGPRWNWNRGRILKRGKKIVGAFYSGAMRVALTTAPSEIVGACYKGQLKSWARFIAGLCLQPCKAPEGIEIVGAFYNGVWKSWAHLIAGLCLQPWPQRRHWNRGPILQQGYACSLGHSTNWNRGSMLQRALKIVGTSYRGAMPAAFATARTEIVGAF